MPERVFALPDLGEGLEEGVVTAWLVAEGDEVTRNQPIAEIETAKAVVEMPSPYAGRIVRLHAEAGSTVSVGAPLVTFDVAETMQANATNASDARPPGTAEAAPTVRAGGGAPVAATPAVRRRAKDLGVDLASVTGSGPAGRVTREDVERAAFTRGEPVEVPLEGGHTWTVAPTTDVREVPVSPTRRTMAKRLGEVAAVPQVTTFRQLDCTALDAFRRELGLSPLPVFVRALAEVCADHPMVNAAWDEERILLFRDVHVGIATDTERGLVVPVVSHAPNRGIGEIAAEIERLARGARDGTLAPKDVSGATIAVSNTGSYGSQAGTPLLNPGHAVTVALGVVEPRALVVDGRVEARPACTISLTFDHRVLDGATVGRALTALVELLASDDRLRSLPR